jgi:hypothetical protein
MKARLNEVSMPNWLTCIDRALEKSGATRADIDFLNVLHFKRSMHASLLETLGLRTEQSVYLEDYGHSGQVDFMLSLHEGLRQGRLKDGSLMVAIAAGIGYVWGATVIRWGPIGIDAGNRSRAAIGARSPSAFGEAESFDELHRIKRRTLEIGLHVVAAQFLEPRRGRIVGDARRRPPPALGGGRVR